jgi:hypothetical protein
MAKSTPSARTTDWHGAEVRPCSCPDTDQDAMYGERRRVKNRCAKGWRCTCCSKVEERRG